MADTRHNARKGIARRGRGSRGLEGVRCAYGAYRANERARAAGCRAWVTRREGAYPLGYGHEGGASEGKGLVKDVYTYAYVCISMCITMRGQHARLIPLGASTLRG